MSRVGILLATTLLAPTLLLGAAAQAQDPEPEPLHILLLFHYNQNLVPYSQAASDIAYEDLTRTLLRHPELDFAIHVSGVLTEALQWTDPTLLRLVREGAATGSFEIIGSTYAQNLLFSTRRNETDTSMNANQIQEHRNQIERVYGVKPASFWNAERVWSQELGDVIRNGGYNATFVEDHILEKTGITTSEHLVRTTQTRDGPLVVFNDDKEFLNLFDQGVDDGNWQPTMDFLRRLYDEPRSAEYVVVYAQDAEASGLWDFEGGEDPSVDLGHLDAFLSLVERTPWLDTTTPQKWLTAHAPSEDLTPIATGAADWMGREAWFDENDDPNVQYARDLFGKAMDSVEAVEAEMDAMPNAAAARRLLAHARHALAAHQYEFADLAHANNQGLTEWELVRSVFSWVEAARAAGGYAGAQDSRIRMLEVNQDGEDEVVVSAGGQFYILSPRGGRVLYAVDLATGTPYVAAHDYYHYGEAGRVEGNHRGDLQGGRDVYTWLAARQGRPEIFEHVYRIRRVAFTDEATPMPAGQALAPISFGNAVGSYQADGGRLHFSADVESAPWSFHVEKVYEFGAGSLTVTTNVTDTRAGMVPPATSQLLPAIAYGFSTQVCLAPDPEPGRMGGADAHLVMGAGRVLDRTLPLAAGPLASLGGPSGVVKHLESGATATFTGASVDLYGAVFCHLLTDERILGPLSPGQTASVAHSLGFVTGPSERLAAPPSAAGAWLPPSYARHVFFEGQRLAVQSDGSVVIPGSGTVHYETVWDHDEVANQPPAADTPAVSWLLALSALVFALAVARWRRC